MKSSHGSDEIQGVALDEIKSVYKQSREAGFHRVRIPLAVYCVIRRVVRRIANFIHRRWISPVKDGFDCVILR